MATVGTVVLLAVLALALPIPAWRTGELPAPPLPVVEGGPLVPMAGRVWIDTDAACGHDRRADPDDCLALLLLARSPGIEIAGISTVFGNAPLDVADRTTRDLVARLEAAGADLPAVQRGSGEPLDGSTPKPPEPAHAALRRALEEGPLTVLALGSLTNVEAALRGRTDLQARVSRLVAVMGRRPGHIFHPAEGAGDGILLGHGPVFRDFNFAMDPPAAARVLAIRLPMTLVPYDAAREIDLDGGDFLALEGQGGAAAWVAGRARGWLAHWQDEIGRPGFYPFDLLAGAYLVEPRLLDCAEALAWVAPDDVLWNLWFHDPPALLVGLPENLPGEARASAPVVYCAGTDARTHRRLMDGLLGSAPPAGP